jgi:hypothetical protein
MFIVSSARRGHCRPWGKVQGSTGWMTASSSCVHATRSRPCRGEAGMSSIRQRCEQESAERGAQLRRPVIALAGHAQAACGAAHSTPHAKRIGGAARLLLAAPALAERQQAVVETCVAVPAHAGHVSLPDEGDQGLQSGRDHIGVRGGQQARQVLLAAHRCRQRGPCSVEGNGKRSEGLTS